MTYHKVNVLKQPLLKSKKWNINFKSKKWNINQNPRNHFMPQPQTITTSLPLCQRQPLPQLLISYNICRPYKWGHLNTICSLLNLASFASIMLEIHLCYCMKLQFVHFNHCIISHHVNISQFIHILLMGIWFIYNFGYYKKRLLCILSHTYFWNTYNY